MTKAHRMQKLDHELSWPNNNYALNVAADSPITYPLATGSLKRIDERKNWVRQQALIDASQFISEFELGMLAKFEMLKWLECGYHGCYELSEDELITEGE